MWTRFHHKVRSSPTTRTCPHLASAPSLPSLRSGHSWWLPLVTGVPTSPSVVTAEPQPLTVQQVKLGQHTLSVSVPPTSSLLRPHFTLLSHLLSSPLSLSSSLSLCSSFPPYSSLWVCYCSLGPFCQTSSPPPPPPPLLWFWLQWWLSLEETEQREQKKHRSSGHWIVPCSPVIVHSLDTLPASFQPSFLLPPFPYYPVQPLLTPNSLHQQRAVSLIWM